MLKFLLGNPRKRAMSDDGQWRTLGGGLNRSRVQAGVVVDEDIALTYAACWCATRIISETSASLPLFLYRRLPGGDRQAALDHYQFDIVKTAPNPTMGSMAFREGRTVHQVNWGNGFAEIEREPNGNIAALWPIHPSRVQPVRSGATDRNGRPLLPAYPYLVRNNDGTQIPMQASELLHVPGCNTEDGIWGKGVIAYARESVGFGIATERHGATMFGSGMLPRGFLKLPGLKDPEARRQFRQEWKDVHGHPDSGEIAILPVEADFQHLTMNFEDSQFLSTREHNVKEIARWYRVPSSMLGDLSRSTHSNIEQQSIDFIIYSLLPWLARWEEQLSLKLLTPEDRKEYYFEHQVSGLLRGDITMRYGAYQIGLNNGWLTINQICRMENLPGIGPAGDQNFIQLNMTTAQNMLAGIIPGKPTAGPMPTGDADPAPEDAAEGDPGAELLDLPDYRQPDGWSCGAAVVHSVCEFFGVGPATHKEYVDGLGTTPADGTSVGAIVDFLLAQGLKVTAGGDLDVDDLRELFLAGQPVICPVQAWGTPAEERAGRSGHYVAVIGVGLGQVFVQDPSAGRRLMTAEEFLADWFDVGADGREYTQFGIAAGDELPGDNDDETTGEDGAGSAGDPKAPKDPATEGSAADPSEGAAAGTSAQAAARGVLIDVLGRMFTKEAKAAQRAAKGKDFDGWLLEFYGKHKATLTTALAPAIAAVGACGGKALDVAELAGKIVGESQALLRHSYDTETPAQFLARVEAWPTERAKETAESILGGKSDGIQPKNP